MKTSSILALSIAASSAHYAYLVHQSPVAIDLGNVAVSTTKTHSTAKREVTGIRGMMSMPNLTAAPGCSITSTTMGVFVINHCSPHPVGKDLPKRIDSLWIPAWNHNQHYMPVCEGIRPIVGETVLIGGYPDKLKGKYVINEEKVISFDGDMVVITGGAHHGMSGGPIVSKIHECVYAVTKDRVNRASTIKLDAHTRGVMLYTGGQYGDIQVN